MSEDTNGTQILEEMNPNSSLKLSTFSLSGDLDPEQGLAQQDGFILPDELGNGIRVVFNMDEGEEGLVGIKHFISSHFSQHIVRCNDPFNSLIKQIKLSKTEANT